MKTTQSCMLALALAVLTQPAWGIYKCVGRDKKVTYQDQACQASSVSTDLGDLVEGGNKTAADAAPYPPGTPGALVGAPLTVASRPVAPLPPGLPLSTGSSPANAGKANR